MTKIELKHVSKTIHKNEVLHDISFMMESGKIYGFQGGNGSGKTMLMRIIIGLIHPTNGSVEINGKVLGRELEFPESIGFLLENPAFLDRYSGYSNLKLLAEIQNNISDAEIKEVLSLVGLNEEASKKKYRKYSLGMKQRLGIAAAIMENPDILILDEPFNGLDKDSVKEMRSLLLSLRDAGKLILLASHNPLDISLLCDSAFEIDRGMLFPFEITKSQMLWNRNNQFLFSSINTYSFCTVQGGL